jgi:hypothetical protein
LPIVPASQIARICLDACQGPGARFRHLIAAAVALTAAHASASLLDTTGSATVRMTRFSQGYAVADVTIDNFGNIGVGQLKGLPDGAPFLT